MPLLTGRAWMAPVLDTFVRGLPRTFRAVDASEGTRISVLILGEAGGSWTLVKEGLQWQLSAGLDPHANSTVQIDQDLAWRLFTKGVPAEASRKAIQIEGDARLGEQVLKLVSIMA
jgi:ubiquinone biosynthesis protein UbiJ